MLFYYVLVIAPVVFADSLFLLANLDQVDISFHNREVDILPLYISATLRESRLPCDLMIPIR